ncbi:nitroreductase family protein [Fructobacillus papyrifericola]|uniref:NADPH-dependent oxidoreductase n=1 Tax=Fructobacillus papyrifericola TaxID=2713172 RepID=A0ABS5QUF4_9LACO|nr:nitroreductase family protein [Fructobacillus papyrifericola]MBS9336819.1 NADPH-dependent oxidoreductase [Fructobacillus papyrifericola]
MENNQVLEQLQNHQSIRAFQDKPVSDETMDTIFKAAFAGPNMQNYQPVTFIEVTDQALKQKITDTVHMGYIASAPRFYVACVDWNRDLIGQPEEAKEIIEDRIQHYQFLEGGIVSTAITLCRAQVAAESLGLGTVTMAGVMGAFELYEAELDLPKYVKPIMGFSVGYPDQNPGVKPKLPLSGSVMAGKYDEKKVEAAVKEYDQTMADYYGERDMDTNWTKHNAKLFKMIPADPRLSKYPMSKGLNLK